MIARSPGEKRRRKAKRIREQAAYAAAVAAVRATGASCSTCQHWIKSPVGRACDLESDFEGYTLRKAEDVCPRHKMLARLIAHDVGGSE